MKYYIKIGLGVLLFCLIESNLFAQPAPFPFLPNFDFEESDPSAVGHVDPFHSTHALSGPWRVSHGTPTIGLAGSNEVCGGEPVGYYAHLEARSHNVACSQPHPNLLQSSGDGIFYDGFDFLCGYQYRMIICYRAYHNNNEGAGTVDKIIVSMSPKDDILPLEQPSSVTTCPTRLYHSDTRSSVRTVLYQKNNHSTNGWTTEEVTFFSGFFDSNPNNSMHTDRLWITVEDEDGTALNPAVLDVAYIKFECLDPTTLQADPSVVIANRAPNPVETASQDISSSGYVPTLTGKKVELEAGDEILFYPNSTGSVGFFAERGSDVLAYITDQGSTQCFYSALGPGCVEYYGKGLTLNSQIYLGGDLNKVSISPNPTTSQFTLSLELKETTDLSVNLYNIAGQEVKQFFVNQKGIVGKQEYQLSVDDLPAGVYLLRLQTSKDVLTKELIIQR